MAHSYGGEYRIYQPIGYQAADRPIVVRVPDLDPSIHVAHAHMRSSDTRFPTQLVAYPLVL